MPEHLYEYRVEQLPAGGSVTRMSERITHMAQEGWEPILMSGDAHVNVLMRRAKAQAPPPQVEKPREA